MEAWPSRTWPPRAYATVPSAPTAATVTPSVASAGWEAPVATVKPCRAPSGPITLRVDPSTDQAGDGEPEAAIRRGVVIPSEVGMGVGADVGAGFGGGGGAVTKVTARWLATGAPDWVLALGPTTTWYWVFGARPFSGTTSTVLVPVHW